MLDTLLWDCGLQRDLIEPEGAAPVPGAAAMRPRFEELVRRARAAGIPRLSTRLCGQDGEPGPLGGCGDGTPGQDAPAELAPERPIAIPPRVRSRRGVLESVRFDPREIVVELLALDPFSHPQLGAILDELAPRRVVLFGLPGESTVAWAAEGLLGREIEVSLVADAVAAADDAVWAAARGRLAGRVAWSAPDEMQG